MAQSSESGLSLLEVLYAIMLFSMIVTGLVKFQASLLHHAYIHQDKVNAQQIAFDILERYPDISTIKIKSEWQYDINLQEEVDDIVWVTVKVISPLGAQAIQRRMIALN